MSPEEIQAMTKGMAEGQAVWYVLSAILGGLITGAGAYWAEKGKNRATKEDIAGITHEVERVRDEFNRGLEDLKAHHQLRLVAAERRMQAHQDAFMYGSKIWQNIRIEEEEWQLLWKEAQVWHDNNVLFLGKETRQNFIKTLNGGNKFRFYSWQTKQEPVWNKEDMTPEQRELRRLWDDEVMAIFQSVVSEIELPAIGELIPKAPPAKVG